MWHLFAAARRRLFGTPACLPSRDQAEVSALWGRIFHAPGPKLDTHVNINRGRTVASKGPVAALDNIPLAPREISDDYPSRSLPLQGLLHQLLKPGCNLLA